MAEKPVNEHDTSYNYSLADNATNVDRDTLCLTMPPFSTIMLQRQVPDLGVPGLPTRRPVDSPSSARFLSHMKCPVEGDPSGWAPVTRASVR